MDYFVIHVFKRDGQWIAFHEGRGWTAERGYGKTPLLAALDLCGKCEESHFQMLAFQQIGTPLEEGATAFRVPFARNPSVYSAN